MSRKITFSTPVTVEQCGAPRQIPASGMDERRQPPATCLPEQA
jgi:hypothetical protein